MNRRLCFVLIILFTLLLVCNSALASSATPRADLYFDSATAFLSSSKTVVFDFSLFTVHNRISVVSVWLQQKIDGEWERVKFLTPPSYVATNMASYGTVSDYSSDIGTGTFRIGFMANADGHTITRYSNSRTY